jgi:DNA modification methylase
MTVTYNLYRGSYSDTLLNHVSANLICTSPPYNIGSRCPAKTGKRNSRLKTYDPKSYRGIREYQDSLPEERYQESQVVFLKWCEEHLADDGILAYNHKPRRKDGRLIHPLEWISRVPQLSLMEEIIWDRGSTHNHSSGLMWPHTERIYILHRTGDKYCLKNTRDLDFRSDVWRIPRSPVNGHNAPFPEALARAIIRAWSKPGQLVIDPYMGSGTTGAAAISLGRNFAGAEILNKYYQMVVNRMKGVATNV